MPSSVFWRKLTALDYQNADAFSVTDENEVKSLIIWLEDQKIRHYKIEDRGTLRSGEWPAVIDQYLQDVGCPITRDESGAYLDWLLGFAVRLEYGDQVDKYRNVSAAAGSGDMKKSANPLDNLDFESADFKAGVASLSQMLQIPPHHDHLIVLQAVCLLIKERFSKEAVQQAQQKKDSKGSYKLGLDKVELGFETGDYISAEAAKILRLLHIQELRELQTKINEAIVQVQALTANPKTDARLGKVGIGDIPRR